ncbi:MAG: sugar transferase [Planctomycetota bacterium]|jgi:lipopolysaccharide/colanic/teichoic acid biosynthesis glycosyltransferase|nr:sugar transferase [Planctomycetota bacterium]
MTPVPGKRGFDLMIACAALACAWPLVLAMGFLVRREDGGSAVFCQQRVGRSGHLFTIFKLRTMGNGSGRAITVGADPRITRIGALLRRTKLDELPQLYNIIRGDMSLVGLRPEVPAYVERYDAKQRALLLRRPGLTDPASIRYRSESDLLAMAKDPEALYLTRIMPDKLRVAQGFARGETLSWDWRILWRTVRSGVA